MKDFNILGIFKDGNNLPLKKGCLGELIHFSSESPVAAVIKKADEKKIHLKLSEYPAECCISSGDELILKALVNKFEYVISCRVVNIDLKTLNLELSIEDFKKYRNKRKAKRFNTSYTAKVTTPLTFNEINAQVKNISSSGAFIIINGQKPDIGNEGIISIRVDVSADDILYFKVKIVKIGQRDNYDCYYTRIAEIDSHNKKVLTEVLQKLKTDQSAYIREALKD